MRLQVVWILLQMVPVLLSTQTKSKLERAFEQIVKSFSAGEIDAEEVRDIVQDLGLDSNLVHLVGSLVEGVAEGYPGTPSTSTTHHRSKRELEGPLHYMELDVSKIEPRSQYSLDSLADEVISRSFHIGSKTELTFLFVGDQLHQIEKEKIHPMTCDTCRINMNSDNDSQIISTEVEASSNDPSEAYVHQMVLNGKLNSTEDTYQESVGSVWKVKVDEDSTVAVQLVQEVQMIYLENPVTIEDAISRTSLYAIEDGLLMASFFRNRKQRVSEGLHIIFLDSAGTATPIANSETILEQHSVEWITDVKIGQELSSGQFLLVVASKGMSYVYTISRDEDGFRLNILQSIETEEPIAVELSVDSKGTYLIFIEPSGQVITYLYDGVAFTYVQNFYFPNLEPTSWKSVMTAMTEDFPEQELIFASINNSIGIYHHVLPGQIEQLRNPSGLDLIAEKDCKVTVKDVGRYRKENDFAYYILLKEGQQLAYHSITISPFPATIGIVDDVSICLIDLDLQLSRDEEYAGIISDRIEESLKIAENHTVEHLSVDTLIIEGDIDLEQLDIIVEGNTTFSIENLDYNDDSSKLSSTYKDVTVEYGSPGHLLSNVVLRDSDLYQTTSNWSIQAPQITFYNGTFDTVSVDYFGDTKVKDILHNTLRVSGDQEIKTRMRFEAGMNVLNDTWIHDTAFSPVPLSTLSLFDMSKNSQLGMELKFDNVILEESAVFEAGINDVSLNEVITSKDISSSTSEDPIQIHGKKEFSLGLSTFGLETGLVNGQNFKKWYDSLIWKDVPHQTIKCSSFSFVNITALKAVELHKLEGEDISYDVLNDIVRIDQPAVVTSNILYQEPVNIENLMTNSLNGVDPTHYLISGIQQDIYAAINTTELIATSVYASDINGIDLNDAAVIDGNNTFVAPVIFKSKVTVKDNVGMKDNVSLSGLDPDTIGPIVQIYNASVNIEESLQLKDMDVSIKNFQVDKIELDLTESGIKNTFLLRNETQSLPNLREIDGLVTIKNLELKSTLNKLDVETDLLHTYGDQIIKADNIVLNGVSHFLKDITIKEWAADNTSDASNAEIAGVKVQHLAKNVVCNKDPSEEDFGGILILDDDVTLTSYFDTHVNDHFKVTENGLTKDYGRFKDEVVHLKSSNIFKSNVNFDKLDIEGDLESNRNITSRFENTTLNDKVIQDFEKKIVKKKGTFEIISDLTFRQISGNGQLLGTFDTVNLKKQLEEYILLDDETPILPSLYASNIEISDLLELIPKGEDNQYFNEHDFMDYVDNRLCFDSGNVSGSKTVTGQITVEGNLIVSSATNPNHPFDVSLIDLEHSALTLSTRQVISNPVTIKKMEARSIYTNVVNGVPLVNLCFIDEYCEIDVKGGNQTVVFSKGITLEGGLKVNKSNSIFNDDTLNQLISSASLQSVDNLTVLGDLSWSEDAAEDEIQLPISQLLRNAVVKSGKKWLSNEESAQPITGSVILNGNIKTESFEIKSNVINIGSEEEFNIPEIIEDSAKLDKMNMFNSSKIFTQDLSVGKYFKVSRLVGTQYINDVDLEEFGSLILVGDEPDSLQKVHGDWRFINGFSVIKNGRINGTIDNIQVKDFVLKSKADVREINALVFEEPAVVKGNVTGAGSQFKANLDQFFTDSMRTKNLKEIPVSIIFTDSVEFDDILVEELNGMATDTFVLNNAEEKQVIRQNISLVHQPDLRIHGDLHTDTINQQNLQEFNEDVLRVDREEIIQSASQVVFKENVRLMNNLIIIPEPALLSSLVDLFLETLQRFTGHLMEYYNRNIVKPLGKVMEELYVAERIGFRRIQYLEEYPVPRELQMDGSNFTIVRFNTVDMGQGEHMMRVVKEYPGEACNLPDNCTCQETRMVSGYQFGHEVHDFQETVFTFHLKSGLFTITSLYKGYSDTCSHESSAPGLLVESTKYAVSSSMKDMSGLSAEEVGTLSLPVSLNDVYEVLDVRMWEIGGKTYMAIAQGYSPVGLTPLTVFVLDNSGWVKHPGTFASTRVSNIEVNCFRVNIDDGDRALCHLMVVEEEDETKNIGVKVYEWSYIERTATLEFDGELLQIIPTPSLTSLEVMKFKPSYETNQQILLCVAMRFGMQLEDSSFIGFYQYSAKAEEYVWAIMPEKFINVGELPILKMKSKKISDNINLVVANEKRIQVYDYLPNQGLRLISEYQLPGKLVDFTILEESLPRYITRDKYTSLIYAISECPDKRYTSLLRVSLSGKIDLPSVVFSPGANIGF